MPEVTVTDDIPMGADAVWNVIGDFSGIRKWAVLVKEESTEETPKGKVRSLTMPDGRVVRELLVKHDAHSYTYTLDRPDMKEYFSTVRVAPVSGAASRIELTIQFVPVDDGATAEIKERLTKNGRGNIKAMKRALGLPV
jgi:hypothetical protein